MANEQNLKPFNKGYDPRRGTKPKGTKHLSTHIQELLNSGTVRYKLQSGQSAEDVPIEAILSVLIKEAADGHYKAIEILFKYGYGKPVDDVEPQKLIVETRRHNCICPREDGE